MMRNIFGLTLVLLTGLGGCLGEADEAPEGGIQSTVYCYGDPDVSIVCKDKQDVWMCEEMPNGYRKCAHTPDGEPGWRCEMQAGGLVCTKVGDTGGGAGWSCSRAGGVTTCVTVGPSGASDSAGAAGAVTGFSPDGAGGWMCTGSTVGVVCEGGQPGGGSAPGDQKGQAAPAGLPKAGDFRTQTPGGWGAPAHGNNAGAYRDAHFAATFPAGLTIGCAGGHTATFTTAKAIELFLPAGGTPATLNATLNDPTSTSAGVLAGHLVAATLAVGFDAKDPSFGASGLSIEHLVATSGTCEGMTVRQILALGNAIVGGCNAQRSPSEITGCLDAINNNFVDGDRAGGYLAFP